MICRRVLAGLLIVGLGVLVWFSSHLAAVRIYQVDECQNIYMAKVLAMGQTSEFFTNASLFLMGPLSWICRTMTRSTEIFSNARLLFLGDFWLNIFLLALIASDRQPLNSMRFIIALAAAATLAPLWDYGFEIRHDNLIVTGILLIWVAVRARPKGIASYVLAGVVAISLLFIAVKAVVYVLPLSCAILAFPPRQHRTSRVRLGLAWLAGAVLAAILIRLAYGAHGNWQVYLSVFHGVAKFSAGAGSTGESFRPWWALARLFGQTPLLLALGVSGCVAVLLDLVRRRWTSITWDGNLPELLLVLGAFGGLMVNPTPFPYNLVHFVPYLFLFAFRYGAGLWNEAWTHAALRPMAAAIVVFAHVVPFVTVTQRHLDMTNLRQEGIMKLAEDLTDPVKDSVYDGIGMVPTRPSIHFLWYLHSLNIHGLLKGPGPKVRDMLSTRPAAVIIPSYRTDWLTEEDHAFIRDHYVKVADDFWVLGKVLPPGGGTFEIPHSGRYRIAPLQSSDLAGSYPDGILGSLEPSDDSVPKGTLDGKPLSARPVELEPGSHRLECPTDWQPTVVWVGPHLDRVPRINFGSDHKRLFINWY